MVAFGIVTVDIYDNAAFCILVIFTLIVLHIELIFASHNELFFFASPYISRGWYSTGFL